MPSRPSARAASPASSAAKHGFLAAPALLWLLIFLAVFAAYAPALQGSFLWDDDGHVTRADLASTAGLGRIWFEIGATQQYYPLLHSAFWLEHRLWGDTPLGYHLVNLLLHATAAGLFVTLLRRLAVPGAAFAGLLFALHPVSVESVAWISEQKNTLSAVLYLGAALAYLRFNVERTPRRYAFATILFLLALLTKTVTATLPAALLVVFWWQRGALDWRRDVRPLVPWFAVGAGSGLLTAWFEHTLIGAQGAAFELDALQRGLLAGRVVWFYLGKLLWPGDLIFIYPRWTIDAGVGWQWLFPLAALALLFLLWRVARGAGPRALALHHPGKGARAPLAAALFFGGTLFPVLGFFNVFPFIYSFVADHFQYLASLGVFAATAAAFAAFAPRFPAALTRTAAVAVLLVLGTLTWRQAHLYRDVFTLFEGTIARNPSCSMAYNNLGIAHASAGRFDQAIPLYEQAIALRPDNAEAENNLGYALSGLGRHDAAESHFRRALQLQPNFTRAYNNLAIALMALGRSDEGLAAFTEALRLQPTYAGAHVNLGLALARLGRTAEAIPHFQRAAQLEPDNASAELNWGIGLMLTGRFTEAVPHFERALTLDPDSADNHFTYGRALADHGRYDDAIAHFREALELNPDFAAAHLQLALVLRKLGRADEAEHHYRLSRPSGSR